MDSDVRREINIKVWQIEGGNLRRLRQERKWTQEQLAEKLATNPKYLSPIENGRRGIGEELMKKICKVFDVPEAELRKGTESLGMSIEESLIDRDVRQMYSQLPDDKKYDIAKIMRQMLNDISKKG